MMKIRPKEVNDLPNDINSNIEEREHKLNLRISNEKLYRNLF